MKDETVSKQIKDAISVQQCLLEDQEKIDMIYHMSEVILKTYVNGNKVILCGNGGSAADAQHIAGEMVAKFRLERKALPALALNTNSSVVTAIGNDYDYSEVYRRQIEAFGREGDTLIAISTSGNSLNIAKAMEEGKKQGMNVFALLGKDGGVCLNLADAAIVIPSEDTPRIQEAHILVGHILCGIVEERYFQQ